MLGKGWFPAELGGLDRYYRSLLEHSPGARGVVLGPASDAPGSVTVVSGHGQPLLRRLVAFHRAARAAAAGVDVVDAHFALYAALPVLGGALRRKPLLVHFQGPWADENVAAGETSRWRTAARRALERAVYRRAGLTVTLTGAFRRVLVETYGVLPWDVRVVPPGVDHERFSPGDPEAARARLGLSAGGWVAVCVRRLVPRMGIDVLLDAWASALPGLPAGARLLIAGDGPMRAALAARIEQLPSVTLLGRVSDAELVDLYRAADVNVVPTLAFEGFGLVVTEAAACGTPSIVTDAGGLPEAVWGLDPSLVVPAGDARALCRRLVAAGGGDVPSTAATSAWAAGSSWPAVADRHRELHRELRDGDDGPRPLRVVYLNHVARLSGGEIALARTLPHLEGVSAHVILAEDGPLVEALHRTGASVEVLPMADAARDLRKGAVRLGGVSPAAVWETIRYVARLTRRLRRLRPDVVHTNSLKAGVYGTLAARLAGVPSVWHVRDRIDEDYLPRRAVPVLRRLIHRLPSMVVTNSRATLGTLSPVSEPVLLYSVIPEVMPLGASPSARPARDLVVGMVGRITPWKGQDVFLSAFARAFPDGAQRAVIVGSPMFGREEEQYAEGLRAQAHELGIADRVDFRGFREDVAAELAAMDVLVHASVTAEPFGQVILEGMAAGLPVVATAGGGPSEIVDHDVTGLLYPPGDSAELGRLLGLLDADQDLRARLGAAGFERARDFGPGEVSAKLMAVYAAALDGRNGRRRGSRRR
ncbi:MAG: hypothetical protein QOH43_4892 [Solirubrobacteraceae bacterium]|nr:hypothetical protein [Solirubrobacteraceae bacterium]